MHKSLSVKALVVGLGAFSCHGATIVYEGSYNPAGNTNDRFAPDLTTGGNTHADPVWKWNKTGTPTTPPVVQVNGVWALSDNTTVSDTSFWGVGQGQTNTTAWSSAPATGSTVDFNLNVTAGSITIRAGDTSGYYNYVFTTSAVSNGTSVAIDNTIFHTYRITFQNGFTNLYVDANSTPLFTNVARINLASVNNLIFGDTSSSSGGAWNLTNISWSNAVAEFSAPIPEPSSVLLVGLSALFGLMGLRRLKRS